MPGTSHDAGHWQFYIRLSDLSRMPRMGDSGTVPITTSLWSDDDRGSPAGYHRVAPGKFQAASLAIGSYALVSLRLTVIRLRSESDSQLWLRTLSELLGYDVTGKPSSISRARPSDSAGPVRHDDCRSHRDTQAWQR